MKQQGRGAEGALACAQWHLCNRHFCPACQGMQQESQMEIRKLWEPTVTHPPPPPPPPHLSFPPSPAKAKEKLMRTKKPAAHPLPHPSQWLCRKKPLLQAEVLSQKWTTEAPGRRGRGQMPGVFSQPGISSSLPEEVAFPPPQPVMGTACTRVE